MESLSPHALTRDSFLEELRERADTLRTLNVDVPPQIDMAVSGVIEGQDDPFQLDVFRSAAAHLLEGLDPEMARDPFGADLLTERMCALAANLRVSLRVATERREQPV
jgi:hypothetical protein